jgi:hypothetical protein
MIAQIPLKLSKEWLLALVLREDPVHPESPEDLALLVYLEDLSDP